MTPYAIALLFSAGMLGGCANAIAGGATLITFPSMVASGLPIVIANASNSIAVMPGNIIAALSDREKWPVMNAHFATLVIMSIAGAALGSWLLISHSAESFMLVVPALIGIATILFTFAPKLQTMLARFRGEHGPAKGGAALIGVTAIYGGYFGAGIGVMFMAILSIIESREMRTLNAIKNLLSFACAVPAATIFILSGSVSWPQTLTMMAGATVGGAVGSRLIRVISPMTMRRLVGAIGGVMTVIYAYRYWL